MKRFVGGIVGLVLLGGVAWAQTPDPKQVAAGKVLYDKLKCGTCHMAEGKGNKKLPLDGVNKKLTTAQIRMWIASPAEMEAKLEKKPAVKMSSMMKTKLSDADVGALVAYVQSLK